MSLLLTGATGLLGQYLLRDLLQTGQPIAVLLRSRGSRSAAERLEATITLLERQLGAPLPRPVCLAGDVSRDDLGLSRDDRAWVADRCEAVLHSAASLTFVGRDRDKDPWLSNVGGTANVLDFCRRYGPRRLHYVSTAYVCGKRTGVIREDEFDCAQEFRNDYEASKFEAEALVRSAAFLEGTTIYRPAVIVGDSRTGYTSTYHGLYLYLRYLWLVVQFVPRGADGRIYYPVRFTLTGEEHRNLVPVDWVSAVMTHILGRPELHGRTYHLVPRELLTFREVYESLARHFRIDGPTYAGPAGLQHGTMNEYEQMFYSCVASYQDYWHDEPVFDCRNTRTAAPHLPCAKIDLACLLRLLDFAVRDGFGRRREARRLVTGGVS